jgi:CheY-like chemotaxis protein/HPt (histidine-containing phosphotransfer) domain-containing protein
MSTGAAHVRLLIAEDNAVNQKVAVAMLAALGYDAHVVANGAEACEAVQTTRYGAVLMDCQMPVMDGYAATAAIRAAERGGRIPIIAMTASAMTGEKERCLQAGMDDYVPKPVALDELRAVLRRWVGGSGAPEPTAEPDAADHGSTFDPGRVASLRALRAPGTPDMFLRLARVFVEQAEPWLAELRRALSHGDAENARRLAHAVRGGAGTIGAMRLADLCAGLEERLADGGSARLEAFGPIEEAFAAVRSSLDDEERHHVPPPST